MFRELLALLVDTVWSRCLACGRRAPGHDAGRCEVALLARCSCAPDRTLVGGFDRGCPVHDRAAVT